MHRPARFPRLLIGAATIACAAALTPAAAVAAVSAPAAPADAAQTGPSGPSASSPMLGVLHGVAATSARNAWAVGHGYKLNILTSHWNGAAWTRVPSPSLQGNLVSVAATSARNAWAVGYSAAGALILHWNGTAWKRVPSPSRVGLVSVAATSARNAWAVGSQDNRDNLQITLILHWNGTAWKRVPSPNPPAAHLGLLTGVIATSAGNAWAVGYWQPSAGNGLLRTLILHWNGTAWKRVPSPNPPGNDSLGGVAATSARNAWAVGSRDNNTLILHWNGTAWKWVRRPSPPRALLSVAATSTRNAWAVGSRIIMDWNGGAWTPQLSNDNLGVFTGVAATSARNAWAVGYVCSFPCDAQTSFIVIEHWNGTAWKAQKLARSVTGEPRSRIGLATPPRKTARCLTHYPRNAFA